MANVILEILDCSLWPNCDCEWARSSLMGMSLVITAGYVGMAWWVCGVYGWWANEFWNLEKHFN